MLTLLSAEASLSEATADLQKLFQKAPQSFRFGKSGRIGIPDRGIWIDYWADKKRKNTGSSLAFLLEKKKGSEPFK